FTIQTVSDGAYIGYERVELTFADTSSQTICLFDVTGQPGCGFSNGAEVYMCSINPRHGAQIHGIPDIDHDTIADSCDTDRDGDGVLNDQDNCPDTLNADQANSGPGSGPG